MAKLAKHLTEKIQTENKSKTQNLNNFNKNFNQNENNIILNINTANNNNSNNGYINNNNISLKSKNSPFMTNMNEFGNEQNSNTDKTFNVNNSLNSTQIRINNNQLINNQVQSQIDRIKRKYTIQNKNLAKTNSEMLIKINNLENKINDLLIENLKIKNENLILNNFKLNLINNFENNLLNQFIHSLNSLKNFKIESNINDNNNNNSNDNNNNNTINFELITNLKKLTDDLTSNIETININKVTDINRRTSLNFNNNINGYLRRNSILFDNSIQQQSSKIPINLPSNSDSQPITKNEKKLLQEEFENKLFNESTNTNIIEYTIPETSDLMDSDSCISENEHRFSNDKILQQDSNSTRRDSISKKLTPSPLPQSLSSSPIKKSPLKILTEDDKLPTSNDNDLGENTLESKGEIIELDSNTTVFDTSLEFDPLTMKSPELHKPNKETIMRNSRRRKSINYTLPSLKQKMRRESEKFVDAVIINKKEELKNRRKTMSGLGNIKKFKIHQDNNEDRLFKDDFGDSSDADNKKTILQSIDHNVQKHKRRKTIMVDKSKNEDTLDSNSRRKSIFDLVDDDDDNYPEERENDDIENSNENIYRKRFDKVNKFSSQVKKTSRRYTLNTYGSN
ncbi:hypothetical protein B5S29_g1752 [[Candida] boidinii]|nr:hypothetical protein B5S29_g1752 [[Candida] boidinii]